MKNASSEHPALGLNGIMKKNTGRALMKEFNLIESDDINAWVKTHTTQLKSTSYKRVKLIQDIKGWVKLN